MEMRTLMDLSADAALAGRPVSPSFPGVLSFELAFTRLQKRLLDDGADPSTRELESLRLLFPSLLQPIQPGDLLAGRIRYPLTAFGPEPLGLGYSHREVEMRRVIEALPRDDGLRQEADEMLAWWEENDTARSIRNSYPTEMARTLPSDAWFSEPGVGFPLYRIAGTILDYERLLRLGIPGLKTATLNSLSTFTEDQTPQAVDGSRFLKSLLGALEVLGVSLQHYAEQALQMYLAAESAESQGDLKRIADACRSLRERAPQSFHEACQLLWIYALHSGTWNYGRLDVILGPFLHRDIESGRLDEKEALRLLCNWWRLMKAYENQYNNRVCIGGLGRGNKADEAMADRFAMLAIEATRRVRLNQPQLSLRFHQGQNPALMKLALTAIGEGCTFPIFYNDDVNTPAVACSHRVPAEDAAQYIPYGCGEYTLAHRALSSPNGVVNLPKALELALRNGYDPVAGAFTGQATGDPSRFNSFEELWKAYAAQIEPVVIALAAQQKLEYEFVGREAPYLFLSALYDDCIVRGKALLNGGVRYLSGTLETYGNTNVADSLNAIDELVYHRKKLSLRQIVAACDANFEGTTHQAVRRELLSVPKYGNDDEKADDMVRRVNEHICKFTREQAAKVGLHSYLVVIINNWANVVLGAQTWASSDGRCTSDPFANANNPAPGADRSGVTAFLKSLVKLDPNIHAGAVQNMKFSRELFSRHGAKLEALLASYWKMGGTQAMITVVSHADLKAAMAEPGKWGHLMVRVGGFSARFIDLPKRAQEEILQRTCHE